MKIIGLTSTGNYGGPQYIAVVDHNELQKLTDRYYGKSELPALRVGDEMNLGAGHDFRADIQSACKAMADASKSFNDKRITLTRFANMVSQLPAEVAPEESV